jgi:LPS export ABC transporter protein LptC
MGLDAILTATMKSKITIRNILLFFIIALLGTVSFVLWRNFKIATPEQLVEILPDNVDIALDNVDYTETRGDRRFWRLQADSVVHEAQLHEAQLENVRMTFYDQGEFGDIQMTARRGKWFSETGDIELVGDVVAKNDQGLALYCQQLFYDNKAELITSESAVRLVSKDMETTGQGLQVFLPQQRMLILDQVHTRLSNW